jgi:hypothetical protein
MAGTVIDLVAQNDGHMLKLSFTIGDAVRRTTTIELYTQEFDDLITALIAVRAKMEPPPQEKGSAPIQN